MHIRPAIIKWIYSAPFGHTSLSHSCHLISTGLLIICANKLDKQELQCRLAESKSLRYQAELAHILRAIKSTVGEMARALHMS